MIILRFPKKEQNVFLDVFKEYVDQRINFSHYKALSEISPSLIKGFLESQGLSDYPSLLDDKNYTYYSFNRCDVYSFLDFCTEYKFITSSKEVMDVSSFYILETTFTVTSSKTFELSSNVLSCTHYLGLNMPSNIEGLSTFQSNYFNSLIGKDLNNPVNIVYLDNIINYSVGRIKHVLKNFSEIGADATDNTVLFQYVSDDSAFQVLEQITDEFQGVFASCDVSAEQVFSGLEDTKKGAKAIEHEFTYKVYRRRGSKTYLVLLYAPWMYNNYSMGSSAAGFCLDEIVSICNLVESLPFTFKDLISKSFDQVIKEAYDSYKTSKIGPLEKKIASVRKEYKSIKSHLIALGKTLNSNETDLLFFNNDINTDVITEELRKIESIPQVEKVIVSNPLSGKLKDSIVTVCTDTLYVYNTADQIWHISGRYYIRIPIMNILPMFKDDGQYTVKLYNQHFCIEDGYRHGPHVDRNGVPCLGTNADLIQECMGSMSTYVRAYINSLCNADPSDGYGRGVRMMPTLKSEHDSVVDAWSLQYPNIESQLMLASDTSMSFSKDDEFSVEEYRKSLGIVG